MDFHPIQVRLCHNPWGRTVPDGVLLQYLQTAAIDAQTTIRDWVDAGEVEDGRDSFAAVLLDPTRPRDRFYFPQRVLAIILIGPHSLEYAPNGASKADGHDRHGLNMGELVETKNHLLGDGEFGWGNSAEYDGMIGGGSGLTTKQDGDVVYGMLVKVVDSVRDSRRLFLDEQRRLKPKEGHRWFDPDDEPHGEYRGVIQIPYVAA